MKGVDACQQACNYSLEFNAKRDNDMFKIRGYDKLFGEFYWLPEVYETYEEAFEQCKTNESVIKLGA